MNTMTTRDKFENALKAAKKAGIKPLQPFNFASGTRYTGVDNCLILTAFMINRGYRSCAYATFKQIEALGGSVKGQRGIQIAKLGTQLVECDDGNKKAKKFIKFYTVFNLEQVHDRRYDDDYQAYQDKMCEEPLLSDYRFKAPYSTLESCPLLPTPVVAGEVDIAAEVEDVELIALPAPTPAPAPKKENKKVIMLDLFA